MTNVISFRSIIIIVLIAGFILLIPLLAMQFTNEVNWDLTDFAVAGTLIIGTGLSYQLVTRKSRNIVYRAAVGVAIGTALLIVWLNLAVGIIGAEDNPANLMYIGILTIAIIGAIIARFQPYGMSRTLIVTALAQVLVTVIALVSFSAKGPSEIVIINGFFIALWVGSAWLFRKAARVQAAAL